MEDLKPCPFCSGLMYVGEVGRSWYEIQGFHGDGCIIEDFSMQVPMMLEQKAALIRDWNTRNGTN